MCTFCAPHIRKILPFLFKFLAAALTRKHFTNKYETRYFIVGSLWKTWVLGALFGAQNISIKYITSVTIHKWFSSHNDHSFQFLCAAVKTYLMKVFGDLTLTFAKASKKHIIREKEGKEVKQNFLKKYNI